MLKKNIYVKATAIILSVILMGASAGLFLNVIRAICIFGKDQIISGRTTDIKAVDSNEFISRFNNDLYSLANDNSVNNISQEIRSFLTKEKAKTVNDVLKKYNNKKAILIRQYLEQAVSTENYDYISNYLDTSAKYTVPQKKIRNLVQYDKNAPSIIRDVQNILNGTKGIGFLNYENLILKDNFVDDEFYYSNTFLVNNTYYTFNYQKNITLNENIKEEIETSYDNFVDDYDYYSDYSFDYLNYDKNLKYYLLNKNTNKVVTNLSRNETVNDIKNSDIYYANIYGRVESKGLDKFVENFNKPFFTDDCECFISISNECDYYNTLNSYFKSANNQNFLTQLIISAVLAAVSLILGIFVLINVSNKRIFIDKLFTDIHLALTATIIALFIAAPIVLLDNSNDLIILYDFITYAVALLSACIWAFVCEFFCSLIRVCKSNKKLTENCITLLALRWIYRKVKTIFKKFKSMFTYKFNKMKRSALRLIFLILAIDAFLVILIIASTIDSYFNEWTLALCIVLATINIYVAYKIYNYFILLDKTIEAAKTRTDIDENYEILPSSLQILLNSMKYTNNELNAAVAKAVKDERLRSELITNVSHDLKTPLTSIITYVDLLDKCDVSDEKAKAILKLLMKRGLNSNG